MSAETFPSLNPPAWPATVARVGLWVTATGLAVALLSGPAHRVGVLGYRAGLAALAAGALLAMIGALLIAAGLIGGAARRSAVPRVPGAIAIVITLAAVGYLLTWIVQLRGSATIHEVSTDLENPPAFVALQAARERTPGANPSAYLAQIKGRSGPIDVPAQQLKFYPDIQPLTLAVTTEEAYARAHRAMEQLGWEIAAEAPQEGRLEATDTTRFFGFKDDIVVRIQPAEGGVRVDARSKSRVGLSDLGANARRVRRFLELMQDV
jgi:uncharacterized protein (DUF1499 family)